MRTEELLVLSTEAKLDRWLVDGEPVERWNGAEFHSPGHAAAIANLPVELGRWCDANGDFRAFGCRCPYLLAREPDTLVTFDVSAASRRDCKWVRSLATHIEGTPRLAVEVCEPDEDTKLLGQRVAVSLKCGVPLVWVVDPVEEIVVVHRQRGEPDVLNGRMELLGGDALPGFRCSVAEIFE